MYLVTVEVPINWQQWRCTCGMFLVAYDPRFPCLLSKKCPKCKRECVLDNRGKVAA